MTPQGVHWLYPDAVGSHRWSTCYHVIAVLLKVILWDRSQYNVPFLDPIFAATILLPYFVSLEQMDLLAV